MKLINFINLAIFIKLAYAGCSKAYGQCGG